MAEVDQSVKGVRVAPTEAPGRLRKANAPEELKC